MSEDFGSSEQASESPDTTPDTTPYINVKLLPVDTVLLLEGESDIYELTVTHPYHGIGEISSNLPELRDGVVGQFLFSTRWDHPGMRVNVIRPGWSMRLRFRNGEFDTQAIVSARVSGCRADGQRWSYDVF